MRELNKGIINPKKLARDGAIISVVCFVALWGIWWLLTRTANIWTSGGAVTAHHLIAFVVMFLSVNYVRERAQSSGRDCYEKDYAASLFASSYALIGFMRLLIDVGIAIESPKQSMIQPIVMAATYAALHAFSRMNIDDLSQKLPA